MLKRKIQKDNRGAEGSDKTFGNAFRNQLGATIYGCFFENGFSVVFDGVERYKKLFGNLFVL